MFRKWEKILEVCDSGSLMVALATIDLATRSGQTLLKAFPDCFSYEKDEKPVPWSIIKKAYYACHVNGEEPLDCCYWSELFSKLGVPVILFSEDDNLAEEGEFSFDIIRDIPLIAALEGGAEFEAMEIESGKTDFAWNGEVFIALSTVYGVDVIQKRHIDFTK